MSDVWDRITDALPAAEDVLGDVALTLLVIGVAFVIWLVTKRAGQRWVDRMEQRGSGEVPRHEQAERHQRFATLWYVLRMLAAVTIVVLAGLVVMGVWGIPIAPFLAIGTVVGIGVGLGAQDFVKSVIAGFFVVVEDQYGIGDVVTVAGVSGAVEKITLRTTVLRDLEGSVHHVPNGNILVATNSTAGHSAVVIDVSVGYGEDVDRVIEVIADEATEFSQDPEWDAVFLDEPSVLGVNLLGDWSVDVRVVLTVEPEKRWVVKRAFLRAIKKRLDAEDIEIPFPYRTIVDAREAYQG